MSVLLVAAVLFVESYFGSAIGVLARINPIVSMVAAIVGNIISMLAVVLGAHRMRSEVVAGREQKGPSPRRQKLCEKSDKYGIAGVSLLGQTILPSLITSVVRCPSAHRRMR